MSFVDSRLSVWLLVAGMAAGAAMAAAGILERSPGSASSLGADEIARVGEQPIRQADFQRALRGVEADRRVPLSAGERRHVLDRLIDEELLIQRGVELGLAERDPRLRAELSASVIGLLVAQAEAEVADPDREVLVAFYEENRDRFRRASRFRVANLFLAASGAEDDAAARRRAEELARRLGAGASIEELRGDADRLVAEPPDDWLLGDTIQEYLGPSVALAVAGLEEGGVTEPIRSFGGYHIVRLLGRRGGEVRTFAEVEREVRDVYRRRAGELAVERFVRARRLEVPVLVRSESP